MTGERRPLRQLRRVERLLVRLGRCPTCRTRLDRVPQEQFTSWNDVPTGIGTFINSATAVAYGRSRVRHVPDLHRGGVPHCPKCGKTFLHGWIYPDPEGKHADPA